MLPKLDLKGPSKGRRGRRGRSRERKVHLFDQQQSIYQSQPNMQNQMMTERYKYGYTPAVFSGNSYMLRPFRHNKIKKASAVSMMHQKKILPLIQNIGGLLDFFERKRFKGPKKIKHLKRRPPIEVEYYPSKNFPQNSIFRPKIHIFTQHFRNWMESWSQHTNHQGCTTT